MEAGCSGDVFVLGTACVFRLQHREQLRHVLEFNEETLVIGRPDGLRAQKFFK